MEMKQENLVTAAIWMIVVTLSLFFLPVFSGVLGGMAGGYLARSWRRGLVAAIVPAVVIAVGMWWLLRALEHPVIGVSDGSPTTAIVGSAIIGLFLGAAMGGWIAEHGRQRVWRQRRMLWG